MIKLFSVDDHIIEPPHLWQSRVPAKYKDSAPKIVDDGKDEFWYVEGRQLGNLGLSAVAGKPKHERRPDPRRYSDMIPGCYDPKERAKDMIADGIFASVLFPNMPKFAGTLFLELNDKTLAAHCVRAYNDFVIEEWCPAGPPGMFVPTIITQLWDPLAAAEEIRRCADLGARALSFPENTVPLGLPSYWTDHWNPVWQACQDHDIVVCLHIGTSGRIPTPSPEAPASLSYALLQLGSIESSVNIMMSPVCRNYPGLKFVFSEGGIGWVPNALERADRMYERHTQYNGLDDILPSEIFKRNMYLAMIEEPICLRHRADIGIDRIMWECDYPHNDTTFPDSQEIASTIFKAADVPDDEITAIASGNAERVFNWKMADADALVGSKGAS